jgi:hydroxymethylbilane synthase
MSSPFLRLGTRGSPLALWQADAAAAALARVHNVPDEAIERIVVRTTGDTVRDRPLADVGGKGLFTRELDEALAGGAIDLAVHSAKDVPSFLPAGIVIAGCLPRADPRDALVAPHHGSLAALPNGALVGTASVRRAALLRRRRPDLRTTLLRGNVGTRLRKIEGGACEATLLALAGLKRLGLAAHASEVLDPADFPPALAQGIIAITARTSDARILPLVSAITDTPTMIALTAERAVLAAVDGSCRTPIAGITRQDGGDIAIRAVVIAPDGSELWEAADAGPAADADAIGTAIGRALLAQVPAGIIGTGA